MTKLRFSNYSRFSREVRSTKVYSWCVFLNEGPELLNKIQMIEYTLHPTFPTPVREIIDKEHCFALQSEGWGTFTINIRVLFKGGEEKDEVYMLRLEADDWPKGPVLNKYDSDEIKGVYGALLDSKWDWRKISTIERATELSAARIIEILHELTSSGFVRKAYFRSIENEELWGVTSRVAKLPVIGST
jgi:hypothetical protein